MSSPPQTPNVGRPLLPPSQRRTQRLTLAVTAQEHARLAGEAALADRPVAVYVREVVLGHAMSSKADRAAARELHYIGVNLNQMARVANRTGRLHLAERLEQLLRDVQVAIAGLLS